MLMLAIVGSIAAHAGAAELVCEDAFRPARPTFGQRTKLADFSRQKYGEAFDRYSNGWTAEPQTREEAVARYVHLISTQGRNPEELEDWIAKATPRELAAFSRKLGPAFTQLRIFSIYNQVFDFQTPLTWKTFIFQNRETLERGQLAQLAARSLTSSDALTAVTRAGLLGSPTRYQAFKDELSSHPNVITAINAVALNIVGVLAVHAPLKSPKFSLLRAQQLTPRELEIMRTQGFDAVYPLLQERLGGSAALDRAFYVAHNFVRAAIIWYVIQKFFPELMKQALGPNFVPTDHWPVMIEKLARLYIDGARTMHQENVRVQNDIDAREREAASHPRPKVFAPPKALPSVDPSRKATKGRQATTFDDETKDDTKDETKSAATENSSEAIDPELLRSLRGMANDDPSN